MALVTRGNTPGPDTVVSACRNVRAYCFHRESELQDLVSCELWKAGIVHDREVRLGPGAVIDFLCSGGIGIECKAGYVYGRMVSSQLKRYAATGRVSALVLVTERRINQACQGLSDLEVPLFTVTIRTNWGMAV